MPVDLSACNSDCAANWASAIATFAAVATSLWLARHQLAESVVVRCGRGTLISGALPQPGQRVVRISATNHGHTDVVITGFSWSAGWIKKHWWFQPLPASGPRSDELPKRLRRGESAVLYVGEDVYLRTGTDAESIGKHLVGARFPALAARSLRIHASTATGGDFSARPLPDVLALLRASVRQSGRRAVEPPAVAPRGRIPD